MPTLDEIPDEARARHMLLIAQTKLGKSDYVVQAAIDGYEVLYVDSDNGLPTLKERIKSHPEAAKRIHYFNPDDMEEFVTNLLTLGIFRYNITQRKMFVSSAAKPDDRLVEIIPSRIPARIILSIDTWTSLAYRTMQNAAAEKKVDLTEIDKYGREIYGPANFALTRICEWLQPQRFHQIIQCHPGVFERKEKPPGKNDVLEKDMIIVETLNVPMSSSAPHGASIGKYFNEIAWIEVNAAGQRVIDFTVKKGRISGGTVNGKGDPRKEYSFSSLFGPPTPKADDEPVWMTEMSFEEWKAKQAAKAAVAPKLSATPTTQPSTPNPTATPVAALRKL